MVKILTTRIRRALDRAKARVTSKWAALKAWWTEPRRARFYRWVAGLAPTSAVIGELAGTTAGLWVALVAALGASIIAVANTSTTTE